MSILSSTNELDVIINFSMLLKKYQIFKIKSDVSIKEYSEFYNDIHNNISPLAHAVGKKTTLIACDLNFSISKQISEKYEIRQLYYAEIQREPLYLVFRLLNSLLIRKIQYPKVEADIHELYYLVKQSKSSIVAINIYIGPDMFLSLRAVNFTLAAENSRKEIYEIKGDKVIRAFERSKNVTYYTRGNYPNKKAFYSFLGITPLKKYKASKIFILAKYLKAMRENFKDIVTINFKKFPSSLYTEGRDADAKKEHLKSKIIQYTRQYGKLNIVNLAEFNIDKELKKLTQGLSNYCGDQVEVLTSEKVDANNINITITHDPSYYLKNKLKDPYEEVKKISIISQNITYDLLKKNASSETIVHVLLKELAIKADIKKREISLPNILPSDSFTFIYCIKKKEDKSYRFYKTQISNGTMKFQSLDDYEKRVCKEIEFSIKYPIVLEAIVFKDSDINYITKTNAFFLPNINALEKMREDFEKPINMKTDKLIEICAKYLDESKMIKVELDIQKHQNIFSREVDLHNISLPIKIKKELSRIVGANLTFSPKRKENRDMIKSLIGIRYSLEENFYTVGINYNVNQDIPRASPMRKVNIYGNGTCFLKEILSMLDEYFVKNGNFTVLPYPIKYIREFYKL